MGRIDVPDSFEGRVINICGYADSQYEYADVQVEDRHARSVLVREDDEGRYCGPPGVYEGAVREFLGIETTGTCEEVKGDGEVCGRDLPCSYHSESDD